MSIYLQIFLTLGVIIALVLIYRHRDKDEDFLGLKLMGYYFLGAFRFNLNEFAVPLGFLIYLVAFYPKTNVQIKRNSALLGLLILIVGVAVPRYNDYAFTRPIEVVADSINLYEHSLDEDWTIIKETLEIDKGKINDFEVHFERDGTIRLLRYQIIEAKDGGSVHYNIELVPSKKVFVILRSKVDPPISYPNSILADYFFPMMNEVDFKDILPTNINYWFSAHSQGIISDYNEKNRDNFLILSSERTVRLEKQGLPIQGITLSLFGMQNSSDNSASSQETKQYLLPVVY